ncbi:gluconeogenesis factor YvcK family protein [Synechococcus sp. PCC 7336]|uniref:gluconeogenesis factor YvcK family protein n=1 Tax=Synechococcus sp. PCC 7336 TaxID=195250 RepID=UPI0003468990|nr:gluconeogenesis factor YvcK family protein [Synechococcus sp. PCC 7336]
MTDLKLRRSVDQLRKWLLPGLSVKRWLSLASLGLVLFIIGLAIWVDLSPIFRLQQLVETVLRSITRVVPNKISGPLVLVTGLGLILLGLRRTVGSITEVLIPEGDEEELVDKLLTNKRLRRGPKIVVVGGGTGLSTLLRGLKHYSSKITAVVTVADDGGSSGRLRREIGGLPPGDIRNCLTALASEEKLLTELFQYRFKEGEGLSGHSFGNLFITALSEVTGRDLLRAIAATSQVLAIRGQVLPSTLEDVTLWAEMSDGRWVEGESKIAKAKGQIVRVGCNPPQPQATREAVEAIAAADLIVLGPGSLYTSVIPNLLSPEIVEAIARNSAPHIYVCNIMTEPGETSGYTVSDHVMAIDKVAGRRLFDGVLVQKYSPSERAQQRYHSLQSEFVKLDPERLAYLNCRAVLAKVMREDAETGLVRHDSDRLAAMLMRWYGRHKLD